MQQAGALAWLGAVLCQQAQQGLTGRPGEVHPRRQRAPHTARRTQVRQQPVGVVAAAARLATAGCAAAGASAGTRLPWCLLCRRHIKHGLAI